MTEMFYYCEAQSIDISSFEVSYVTNMDIMFDCCKAQIKATDSTILDKIRNRKE